MNTLIRSETTNYQRLYNEIIKIINIMNINHSKFVTFVFINDLLLLNRLQSMISIIFNLTNKKTDINYALDIWNDFYYAHLKYANNAIIGWNKAINIKMIFKIWNILNSQNVLIDIVWFCDFKMISKIFKQINMNSSSIIIKSKCVFFKN